MTRGRKRAHNPTIPKHIDQAAIPAGIYWDRSGSGRWYVFDDCPEGSARKRARTIAGPAALLSELHAIAEKRAGSDARGTIGYVITQFEASEEFASLAAATRRDYEFCAKCIREFKTAMGATLDTLTVDKLPTAAVQRIVESIAKGKPESRPGAGDAIPGKPAKANHVLRYMRRLFAWGKRFGHCATNPALGVKQAKEKKVHRMPEHAAFAAILAFARERGALKSHTKGSLPPYLAPLMEIAYACRMRGIEAVSLTEAHATAEGLRVSRVKGSRDNITRWDARLRAAWDEAIAVRAAILARPSNRSRPVPMRPEDRPVFVGQAGGPLSKSGLDNAFKDMNAAAIEAGIITADQRFTLHGLKHRGVTDTAGNRADKKAASGHKSDAMLDVYDHELAVVEPARAP